MLGTIIVLVLLASAVGAYRLWVRDIQARSRELENQVEERTRALEQKTREIEQRRQELEALYRADEELHRYLHLDRVLQALVDTAVTILHVDKGALMVWDDQHQNLLVRASFGFSPDTLAGMIFAPGEGVAGQVAITGELAIVQDAFADPRTSKHIIEPEGIRAFMQVPIKIGGEIFGVFSADHIHPHVFSNEEQRLLVALAQRAALAIENAQLYEQAQELAAVQERNRLARDLHDAVTQTLFSASLMAEALPQVWALDPEKGRQQLEEVRSLTRGALAEMRTLLLELRPEALSNAQMNDLLSQLGRVVTGRTNIPVAVKVTDGWQLPVPIKIALYRIAQEALNNVIKHASAGQVSMCFTSEPGRAMLSISDDGVGFNITNIPAGHLGVKIMHERAAAMGAVLEIESQVGHGTQIFVGWQEQIEESA